MTVADLGLFKLFSNFICRKLHENERITWTPSGGHPWCPPLDLHMIYDNIFNKLVSQQECIPVGCVLPALYRRGGSTCQGVPCTENPPDRDPMDSDTPWTETLPRQRLPLDRNPPLVRDPSPTCEQNYTQV